jgi:SAM-dependent methyltransferase
LDTTADAIATQRRYYADTAGRYDQMHARVEHLDSLKHVVSFLGWMGADSVLDTGCGTGLAMRYIADALPRVRVHGNDPARELLDVAVERFGVPREQLDDASSDSLPYADGEFDAVVETGVLHHVPDASKVVAEMLRVARKAVFISDENYFGMGSPSARAAKLVLARLGLLGAVNRRRFGGHDWYYSPADGIAWPYSVFDSLPMLRDACEEVVLLPVGERPPSAERWPLLCSPHCLLAGFKDPLPHQSIAV